MGNVNEYRGPVGCKVIEIAYVFQSCEGIQLQRMALTFLVLDGFGKHHTSQKVIINYQKGFQFLKTRGIEAPSNHTPNWVQ